MRHRLSANQSFRTTLAGRKRERNRTASKRVKQTTCRGLQECPLCCMNLRCAKKHGVYASSAAKSVLGICLCPSAGGGRSGPQTGACPAPRAQPKTGTQETAHPGGPPDALSSPRCASARDSPRTWGGESRAEGKTSRAMQARRRGARSRAAPTRAVHRPPACALLARSRLMRYFLRYLGKVGLAAPEPLVRVRRQSLLSLPDARRQTTRLQKKIPTNMGMSSSWST